MNNAELRRIKRRNTALIILIIGGLALGAFAVSVWLRSRVPELLQKRAATLKPGMRLQEARNHLGTEPTATCKTPEELRRAIAGGPPDYSTALRPMSGPALVYQTGENRVYVLYFNENDRLIEVVESALHYE